MGAAAPVLWRPTPEQVEGSRMAAFAARVGLPLDPAAAEAGYERLWAWSTSERESFWAAVWEDAGVLGERGDGHPHRGR